MDTFRACMELTEFDEVVTDTPRFAWYQICNSVLRKSSVTKSKANLEIVAVVTAMFPHLTAL